MKNYSLFNRVFGITATELWAKSEIEFLEWLNAEYQQKYERVYRVFYKEKLLQYICCRCFDDENFGYKTSCAYWNGKECTNKYFKEDGNGMFTGICCQRNSLDFLMRIGRDTFFTKEDAERAYEMLPDRPYEEDE